MQSSILFTDPYGDIDEIYRVLRDDWKKFSAIMFIVISSTEAWDRALAEVALIEQRCAFAGLDLSIPAFWQWFEMLYSRLGQLPRETFVDRFEKLMATLALPRPEIAARLRAELAMSPEELKSKIDRAWMRDYLMAQRRPNPTRTEER